MSMKNSIKKQKLNAKNDLKNELNEDNESVKEENESVKQQVKMQNAQGPKRWYQESDFDVDDQNKWDYLEHHGVTFPDPYIAKKLSISYDGEQVKLTSQQEQLAWYWCQTLGSQWQENLIYRKNFASQFMERFRKQGLKYNNFNKFDFSGMKHFAQKLRQQKKNISEQQKLIQKKQKEEINKDHGYAIVDDIVEKVNGFVIEPPTLFKGRGKHPRAGFLKPRIQPQEITLNLALDAPIPKCPLLGHAWGDIVNKKDSTWLCSYKNDAISSSSSHKYIFLAANSKFKGQNDRKKYEKARKLKQCIEDIRFDYMKKIQEKDMRNKQLGTATYLIDTLALRVGNQKGQDQADTVGCCSLRVEHIKSLSANFQIQLQFLGKDSMKYENTVKVHPSVWNNIQLFTQHKKPINDLFDKIDAQILNDYLKSLMENLTAKVFRTYNASFTLQKELNSVNLKNLTLDQKLQKYQQANKQVAILCNHQKTVSKKFTQSLFKKEQLVEKKKQYLNHLEEHKARFTTKKTNITHDNDVIETQGSKPIILKYPETKETTITHIRKVKDQIIKQQNLLKKKDENKSIALGTSKTNYNDPRISVAWCKKNQVKVEKVFTKNLLSKFLWAMYTEAEWEF